MPARLLEIFFTIVKAISKRAFFIFNNRQDHQDKTLLVMRNIPFILLFRKFIKKFLSLKKLITLQLSVIEFKMKVILILSLNK